LHNKNKSRHSASLVPNQRNEPCRSHAFVRDACILLFPLANPVAASRSINFRFRYWPSACISHRRAEQSRRVLEQLKRAIHVAVSNTRPTNILADSLRSPSLASRSSNACAMSSVTSRDHPSAVLKATTRIGLEYWPPPILLMTSLSLALASSVST